MLNKVHRIRLENLRKLMLNLNVEPHEVAQDWGTSEQYLKQLLGGKHAKVGLNIATRIENAENLPNGWMSQKNSDTNETSEALYENTFSNMSRLDINKKIKLMADLATMIKIESKTLL